MANPERGEVRLAVNGDSYTLKLSMNAAATLQKQTGKTIGKLLGECSDLDFVSIRSVIWMLLQKYHAEQFKTEAKVGDFIDDSGGLSVFIDAINNVVEINQPEVQPEAGAGGNPPTPGTGAGSTSPAGVSG
jgi:hypothetical protein